MPPLKSELFFWFQAESRIGGCGGDDFPVDGEEGGCGGNRVTKILLLGAAESGKTTVLKQLRIIHSEGFSPREIER